MALNPLDDLITSNPSKPSNNSKTSNIKPKKKSLKANPIFKELRPIMYYGVALAVVITGASLTIFDETKEFHYKNLTEGMELAETQVTGMENDITKIAQLESEISNYDTKVSNKQEELSEANLVRTPLQQSFYFTAYLDSLIGKHHINLIDMYVKASRSEDGSEIDLATAGTLPASGYNLLPIEVEFESTYQNVANLFNDFYTKRIVYDEDLVITNKLDGTVNVKMTVKFEKNTEVQPIEGTQQTQPVEGQVQQPVDGQQIEGQVQQQTETEPIQELNGLEEGTVTPS